MIQLKNGDSIIVLRTFNYLIRRTGVIKTLTKFFRFNIETQEPTDLLIMNGWLVKGWIGIIHQDGVATKAPNLTNFNYNRGLEISQPRSIGYRPSH